MTYIGRTVHGRIVREATLAECIDSLGFVARVPNPVAISYDQRSYYVYVSQAAAEANGAEWFATIEAMP